MKGFKGVLNKIFFPRLIVLFVSVPVSAGLLFYTFVYGNERSPVAYVSYLLSAYALAVVCGRVIRLLKKHLGAMLHRNKHIHRYLTDVPFKTHVSLYLSLAINLFFAAMNLFFGVCYGSVWFGTLAVYYIMLAVMRFLLVRYVNKRGIGTDLRSEWERYRLCGLILLLMNSALTGVVILVVAKNEGFHYAGYLIYVVALYAFYNIITAVRDVWKYRKYQSPVMSAAKAVKLAAALVSMLSLETAMLMQFNDRADGEAFRQTMTGATGDAVCVMVVAMAGFMISRSARGLKMCGTESPQERNEEKENREEEI